jgi:hypothetical protein
MIFDPLLVVVPGVQTLILCEILEVKTLHSFTSDIDAEAATDIVVGSCDSGE